MLRATRHAVLGFAAFFVTFYTAVAQQPSDLRTPLPPPTPHINGPEVYGARPGHPFLYRVPCTGTRPIVFHARHLPASLRLDAKTGIITGTAPEKRGTYIVALDATNSLGRDRRVLRIVIGDSIGLTPQMGWNDWYSYYSHITDEEVRTAANAMISSGMADFGYQFVDIDDCWARKPNAHDPDLAGETRDPQGNILPNARFPDMAALTAYIHSLGLKAGIYSSPGPLTCAGFEGSYGHEARDARQFASWGFDLLKYDWCSYTRVAKDKSIEELEKPYIKMGGLLKDQPRDVVLNMCQYGMGDVWNWGREVGGNSWRTTGDLGLQAGSALPGFYKIGFANAAHSQMPAPENGTIPITS